jgi:modulator of FtsH protease HflK
MAIDPGPWGTGEPPRRPRPVPPWNGRAPRLPPEFDQLLGLARSRLGGRGGRPIPPLNLALLALAAGAFVWLASGFYRVEPDEQALVLRFGAYDRTAGPGLNYHWPAPFERVLRLAVTRINRVEIGFRSPPADGPESTTLAPETEPARGRPPRELAEESLMLTGDENIIDINCTVFWRIRSAPDFAFNTRNPGYTVKSAAESVLRQVIGRTRIESALTGGRAEIEQAVVSGTQAILDSYGSGVEITQVQLQKVDPPEEVIESFRDVQRANTDADRARNEAQAYANDVVPRARGEAAAAIAAAEGEKTARLAEATGAAQRFESVEAAYARSPAITRQRLYIETMQALLSQDQTTIVDDALKGLLPLLPLTPPQAGAPAP